MARDARLTYRDLRRRRERARRGTSRAWASGPGRPVGIACERSLDVVVGLLGILKAGGAYVPLDPAYPRERLAFMLDDARAPVAADPSGHWSDARLRARSGPVRVPRCGRARSAHRAARDLREAPSPATIRRTSSTPRAPRDAQGGRGAHRQVVNRLAWMWRAYPFAPGEVACQKTALSFVDSIWECLRSPPARHAATAIIPDAVLHDPEALVESLAAHRVTRLWLVPSLLRVMLDRFPDPRPERLPWLTFWVTSGEAMPLDLYAAIPECAPRRDARSTSTAFPRSGTSAATDPTLRTTRCRRVPIGRPIANVAAYLLDRAPAARPRSAFPASCMSAAPAWPWAISAARS